MQIISDNKEAQLINAIDSTHYSTIPKFTA